MKWWNSAREIAGVVIGGAATLVVILSTMLVVLTGKLLICCVKFLCLPFIVLASIIFPDERSLTTRIVSDIKEWWRTTQPAL